MKLALCTLSALLLATAPLPGRAAPASPAPVAASAPASADAVDGELRKIDAATGKLTIKHGDIKHLDMPAMTMVFQVRDKAMLNGLKVGDRLRFQVVAEGGKFVITELKTLP